jgi:hypothetical protein
MLVTKKEGKVFGVVQNNKQAEMLRGAFCSRLATHCLNVRLRELNEVDDKYDRKWFVTKKAFSIKQVGVIVLSTEIELLKGVQFYDDKANANEKLQMFLKKHNDASIVEIELYENVPKSEQKKSA